MSTQVDVLVIGAGAAGIAAARAASESGASVWLANDGAGATAHTAGWIAAGIDGVDREALAWLPDVSLRPLGAYAFATIAGGVASGVSGLPSLLDLSDLPEGPLGVVDLIAGPAWSAAHVAASVGPIAYREARVVSVGTGSPAGATPLEVAHALDTAGMIDALAESVRESARGCPALLFPPVLGFMRDDVCERLSSRLECVVGEAGGTVFDGTAWRLARAIERGIPSKVRRIQGRVAVRVRAGRCSAHIDDAVVDAGAIVMATGSLVSGGLVFDGELIEACAHAPVWRDRDGRDGPIERSSEHGLDPFPWFAPDEDGRTVVTRAGLRIDSTQRVLAADGSTPFAEGLFAAGDLLAGGGSRHGASIAEALTSGRRAGIAAARFVSRS